MAALRWWWWDFDMHETDDVMTIDELSRYLKVSKSTLYQLARGGKVPGQKVGKHWRFRKAAIDRWLADELRGGSKP